MALSRSSFEFEIDETILGRGLRYYEKGHVTDVADLGSGRYEAIVDGTETYTVNLEIKGDVVIDYRCDCPYDKGPVCKHIVAALFALQKGDGKKELPVEIPRKKGAKKKDSTPKKKTITQQIDELLEHLPPKELKEYIRGLLMKDRILRNSFLAKYAYLVVPISKDLYARQVKVLVEAAGAKYGFIDYSESRKLGQSLYELISNAQEAIGKENFKGAMYMAGAILEEISGAMNMMDDSSGSVGGVLEEAQAILEELAGSSLDEPMRKELFDYLMDMYERGILGDWDWHTNFLTMAISLIRTETEKEMINTLLNAVKPTGDSWDWDYQKAQEHKMLLIEATGTEEEKLAFMEQNISHPDIRAEIVERAINGKDYKKAIRLLQDGIKDCGDSSPGIVNRWKKYLLTVYLQMGNKPESIQLNRYFVFNGSVGWQDCYLSLKELIGPKEWRVYLEGLIEDINKKSRWINYELIFNIYVFESDWVKLYKLLCRNLTLDRIEKAEKYLRDEYSKELIVLYKQAILADLKQAVGRSHYQNACRYIRRMIKLGGRPEAYQLIEDLKKLYPSRRALREELDKV